MVNSSLTSVGTLTNLTVTNPIAGSVTGSSGSTTGNAATASLAADATKLATPRNINGVPFDGSANINITVDAGALTGNTLASNVVNSSLTSVGIITNGTWNGTPIAVANGGTGLTSAGTKGQVLTSTGSGLAWSVTYSLGYHAELGGYVFYVTPDGDHGLVAATELQCINCTWFEAQNVVSNQANFTDNSVKKFTDWRLPTQHELGLMHQKYQDNSILGFSTGFSTAGWYWSSTITGSFESHARQFGSTNNVGNRDWDNTASTRAVRSF